MVSWPENGNGETAYIDSPGEAGIANGPVSSSAGAIMPKALSK